MATAPDEPGHHMPAREQGDELDGVAGRQVLLAGVILQERLRPIEHAEHEPSLVRSLQTQQTRLTLK